MHPFMLESVCRPDWSAPSNSLSEATGGASSSTSCLYALARGGAVYGANLGDLDGVLLLGSESQSKLLVWSSRRSGERGRTCRDRQRGSRRRTGSRASPRRRSSSRASPTSGRPLQLEEASTRPAAGHGTDRQSLPQDRRDREREGGRGRESSPAPPLHSRGSPGGSCAWLPGFPLPLPSSSEVRPARQRGCRSPVHRPSLGPAPRSRQTRRTRLLRRDCRRRTAGRRKCRHGRRSSRSR